MYLKHYNIKAFFFFFVIFLKFLSFFDFDAFCFVWWRGDFVKNHFLKGMVAENGFEPLTFGL